MPLYTTDALILRSYKLGESDRIVVFLTRDRGKKRGVARNARQSRRRFGGALEPLTLRPRRLPGARAARPGAARLRRAARDRRCLAGGRRGARLRRLLRRADRRVGAGGRPERAAVSGWARRWSTAMAARRPDRSAGAVFRALAAAAAGRLRAGPRLSPRRAAFLSAARTCRPLRARRVDRCRPRALREIEAVRTAR